MKVYHPRRNENKKNVQLKPEYLHSLAAPDRFCVAPLVSVERTTTLLQLQAALSAVVLCQRNLAALSWQLLGWVHTCNVTAYRNTLS